MTIKSVYVGNLPFGMSREEIEAEFAPYTEVFSVKLIYDRQTGRPRGFGFVEVEGAKESAVIQALNGKDFQGRKIVVNHAQMREKTERVLV